jgi:membrane-associated phospholipid phosphatase
MVAGANDLTAGTTYFDDELQFVVPIYAMVLSYHRERNAKGVFQLALSMGLTQVSTLILKRAVNEKRPDFKTTGDRMSFPSGHAAATFAGAMFVHRRHGWKDAVIPYGLALWTSHARVRQNRHRWADILGSAALSGLMTYAAVTPYEKEARVGPLGEETTAGPDSFRWLPVFAASEDGFAVLFGFDF